jgi:transcription antitermination factor NusG
MKKGDRVRIIKWHFQGSEGEFILVKEDRKVMVNV